MKKDIEERIRKHGEALIAHFDLDPATDPVRLCKALRRLENQAHKLSMQWCNGEISEDVWTAGIRYVREAGLVRLLGTVAAHKIYINSDPRGYTLKVRCEDCPPNLYRDMGGYGIIAPDLSEGGVK